MNSDLSEDKEEIRKRKRRLFILIALLILMVLTFAWFYFREKERKRKAEEKENKLRRLEEVELQIAILQAKKEKIEKNEKFIKRSTRIGIAGILLFINIMYSRYYHNYPFIFDRDIGSLLNLNACLISGYTFIAFVSYGSIESFVKKLKDFLVKKLNEYHMYSTEELEALKAEREQLLIDLKGTSEI